MSVLIPQIVKDALSRTEKYQKRVIMVGTRASSKTTSLGCLSLTCDTKTLSDPNFSAFIDEKTSGILKVPSDLCQGRFPPPTPPGWVYEADLIMRWRKTFSFKEVIIPICETAGEDMEKLIGPYAQSVYHRNPHYRELKALTDYICNSNGYIITVPVSRARMFNGEALEEEPAITSVLEGKETQTSVVNDPDVNIRRILAAIFRYKRETRSPKIEGIAVLLTKYDMVDLALKSRGMNLYEREGAQRFLHTYFRATSSLLQHHGMEKVRFFPVHVQVKRVEQKDGSINFSNEILTDPKRNLPIFSEQSYVDLIDWIRETFTK